MSVNIRYAAKKLLPGLVQARDSKLNEADTVQRVIRFFVDVLGYHPDTEVSRELHKHGRYLDIAIKVEGKLQLIVEVKQAGTDLQQKHLDQALRYANEFKSWWALLTNGTRWALYRFVPSHSGIEPFPVFDIDLAEGEGTDQALDTLSCLHRKEMSQESLERLYERVQAATPKVVARALFTEDVLKVLAREIRREQKILFDSRELKSLLEAMFSEEVQEDIGNMRVIKRKPKKSAEKASEASTAPDLAQSGEVPLPAPSVSLAEIVAPSVSQQSEAVPPAEGAKQ